MSRKVAAPARARREARKQDDRPSTFDVLLRADPAPHAQDPTARSTRVFGGVLFGFAVVGMLVAIRLRRRSVRGGARPRAF